MVRVVRKRISAPVEWEANSDVLSDHRYGGWRNLTSPDCPVCDYRCVTSFTSMWRNVMNSLQGHYVQVCTRIGMTFLREVPHEAVHSALHGAA